MAAPIKGILFDKDGTLFDFRKTWSGWARAFIIEMCGGDRSQANAMAAHLGFDMETGAFDKSSRIVAGSLLDVADAVAEKIPGLDKTALIARINTTAAKAPVAQAAPLAPLLDGFHAQGIRLGVATNDSQAAAVAHLDAAGIRAKFDMILGYDSGHGAKPEPGMQHAFCAAFDLDPARVLMVGDSAHDLESGRAAGMGTVAVLTGVAGADDLAPLADIVLPDVGHLPGYIASLS